MGLVHIPRVLFSVGKGLLAQNKSASGAQTVVGVGETNIHKYLARAGLFDVDYLGHLNNAAYLSHAEFARWQWTAENGLLPVMAKNQVNFLVAGSAIRYRREIRPVFRKFQIDSNLVAMDERSLWIMHNFRYPTEGRNRVRAQMIVKGAVVQVGKKGVMDPRVFFREMCGFDQELIEETSMEHSKNTTLCEMLERYSSLENTMRKAAAMDDETHEGL